MVKTIWITEEAREKLREIKGKRSYSKTILDLTSKDAKIDTIVVLTQQIEFITTEITRQEKRIDEVEKLIIAKYPDYKEFQP